MQHANAVAGTDSYFLIAGSSLLPAGELVGVAAGQSIALVAEHKVACFISEKIAYRVIDASSGTNSQALTYFKPPDDCRRVMGQASACSGIYCEHCEFVIPTDNETYYRKILYSNSNFLITNLVQIAAVADLNRHTFQIIMTLASLASRL
jgi:hypothetical protein